MAIAGVTPITLGEVPTKIIAKAVLRNIGPNMGEAIGLLKVCACQKSLNEVAVLAAQTILQKPNNEAVVLVDATNIFNSIKDMLPSKISRDAPQHWCNSSACICSETVRLIIPNGRKIASSEITSQSDPLALAIYAVAVLPSSNY